MARPVFVPRAAARVDVAGERRSLLAVAGDYVALTKPRIIELLLFTTVPTMVVAQRGMPATALIIWTVVGGTLAAGGANAINMYVDRDIDQLMERTRNRPLPSGRLQPGRALVFALVIEAAAFLLLWQTVNLLSAVLAVSATAFYVFIYTLWLKRTSTQNIVIGGAAGAVPVLIGWSSVTNSVGWAPVVLFAVVFFWTPPHFWALAIRYRDDYQAASVPMLPAVETEAKVADKIVIYTVVTVLASGVFALVAGMGPVFWASAVALGGLFLAYALRLRAQPTAKGAMRLFGWSITYLSLLFVLMAVDQLVRTGL